MDPPPGNARRERLVVLACLAAWLVMLVRALVFWARYARDVPWGDSWQMLVPLAAGDQELTLGWLFSFHGVHQAFVPRVLFVLVGGLAGYDFRALPLFDVLSMGAAALVLMRASWFLRGRASLTDASIPIALLHHGHASCLIVSVNTQLTTFAVLASILLAVIARSRNGLAPRGAVTAGICLLLLPLCSLNGLVLAVPLLVWLLVAARGRDSDGRLRLAGLLLLLSMGGIVVMYAVAMSGDAVTSARGAPIGAALRGSFEFLGLGAGLLGRSYHPYPAILIAVLAVATSGLLLRLWRGGKEGPAALGFLLFLLSMLAVAGVVGFGRTASGHSASAPRYVTLVAPFLCCCHVAWNLAGRQLAARAVQAGILLLLIAVAFHDASGGRSIALGIVGQREALAADARAGFPPRMLAYRNTEAQRDPRRFTGLIASLQRAGLGPFRDPSRLSGASTFEPLGVAVREKPRELQLGPGEYAVQRFGLPEAGPPRAVHVLLLPAQGRIPTVEYRLSGVTASGETLACGEGRWEVARAGYFAALCDPLPPDVGELAFSIVVVPGGAADATMRLWIYRPADSERFSVRSDGTVQGAALAARELAALFEAYLEY